MTQPIATISLDAAIAMTGRSRRTWWRRIEKGDVTKLPADARGRTLLVFEEIRPAIGLALSDADVQTIVRADGGDALAQAEAGALFALAAQNPGDSRAGATSNEQRATSNEQRATSNEQRATSNEHNKYLVPALYWLGQAAEQDQPDAMHWLGILYAGGHGGESREHLALMWIARAAAHGHVIAREQMQALTRFPR